MITPLSPTILIGTAAPVYVISPALPAGLSINASTGIISGTPAAGISVPNVIYTVTASNSFGSVSAPVAIMINGLPTLFTYPTPNVYTVGTSIAQLVPTVLGGVFNTYAIAPALPAGLVLNTVTGVITGTPTAVSATATYTVTGTNASGSLPAALQITVNDIPPATFTYNPSPVTVKNGVTVVRSVPVASGGGTVTNYSISPALPQGMSIDPITGIISGIPIAPAGATLNYTITASNSGGSTTATFVMLVDAGAPIPVPQNIITPNNDGVNDFWVIPGITAYRNAEIAIYDKAGRTVYHKKGGYNNDWDGRLNGMPLKNDTYYYIIFINQDGIQPIRGYITIIH